MNGTAGHHDRRDPHAVPRRPRLRVTPPLPPDDLAFLAGFGSHPVHDHDGSGLALPQRVARIWPGQPPGTCPWVPCSTGCCLHLVGRCGVVVAGAWLRFLLAEFLEGAHVVEGTVELPGHGRARAVLIVDSTDVFEGEVDAGAEARADDEEPWSG
jgi:hypothetical protein